MLREVFKCAVILTLGCVGMAFLLSGALLLMGSVISLFGKGGVVVEMIVLLFLVSIYGCLISILLEKS